MKATAIALSALLLSGYAATDNFNRVARIFGRAIFITDLNPTDDELRMVKRSRQDLSDDQIISEVRSEKLAHLIWDPIWAEFDKTHDVKPGEAEIDDHVRAMEAFTAMDPDRRLPDGPKISAKMKKEVEREVAESFVKQWKRSKALYEEYGGVVLFTHFNPMEPVGAMRKLLESHEAKGDFEIYDEQLKQQFWKYYVQDPIPWKVLPPDKVDYSEPWWLNKTDTSAWKAGGLGAGSWCCGSAQSHKLESDFDPGEFQLPIPNHVKSGASLMICVFASGSLHIDFLNVLS
jgi:hypothetical protein